MTRRLAQLFSANGTTIRSGLAVGITAAPPACTLTFAPNMEAAAHDDRFFYVVTSRGRTGSIAQPDSTFLVALLAFGLDNSGIRDLAAVADGILILAGPGRGLKARASLFHWNDTTGQLRQLGVIAEPANGNGEALLVLQQDPEFFRFLVMFDGVENGGPLEYFVSR